MQGCTFTPPPSPTGSNHSLGLISSLRLKKEIKPEHFQRSHPECISQAVCNPTQESGIYLGSYRLMISNEGGAPGADVWCFPDEMESA